MSSAMNAVYNMWLFKKWSEVGNKTTNEIDEEFGKEMEGETPGPLMHEFKSFLENKEWESEKKPLTE